LARHVLRRDFSMGHQRRRRGKRRERHALRGKREGRARVRVFVAFCARDGVRTIFPLFAFFPLFVPLLGERERARGVEFAFERVARGGRLLRRRRRRHHRRSHPMFSHEHGDRRGFEPRRGRSNAKSHAIAVRHVHRLTNRRARARNFHRLLARPHLNRPRFHGGVVAVHQRQHPVRLTLGVSAIVASLRGFGRVVRVRESNRDGFGDAVAEAGDANGRAIHRGNHHPLARDGRRHANHLRRRALRAGKRERHPHGVGGFGVGGGDGVDGESRAPRRGDSDRRAPVLRMSVPSARLRRVRLVRRRVLRRSPRVLRRSPRGILRELIFKRRLAPVPSRFPVPRHVHRAIADARSKRPLDVTVSKRRRADRVDAFLPLLARHLLRLNLRLGLGANPKAHHVPRRELVRKTDPRAVHQNLRPRHVLAREELVAVAKRQVHHRVRTPAERHRVRRRLGPRTSLHVRR